MQTHKPGEAFEPDASELETTRFLRTLGLGGDVVDYEADRTIYRQGDPSDAVIYVQHGSVKLSVASQAGKEAIVGICAGGDFFGEGALASQPVRSTTATTMAATRICAVPTRLMLDLLHQEPALATRVIDHLLTRTIRLEEALLDQLFNTCEQRLARTLLLLARRGTPQSQQRAMPVISQEVLAEMVGTTRSRVNFFMNKFRKQGFIEYDGGGLKVHQELLVGVLRGSPASRR